MLRHDARRGAGLSTIGGKVRYPDALVTCSPFRGDARLIPGVVVLFEVVSRTSARLDRIDKVREYAAVPSIQRYVIVESASSASPRSARMAQAKNGA